MSNLRSGSFTTEEENFIKNNYLNMTDKEIAEKLSRKANSVTRKRLSMGLGDKQKMKYSPDNDAREAYIASLDEGQRVQEYKKELRATSMYKIMKGSFDKSELDFIEESWVEFRKDPTIETLTSNEINMWHQMAVAQVRLIRFIGDEKSARDKKQKQYLQREIAECEKTIRDCQRSLKTTREQRLKDQDDQSKTFANVIKELKDPETRRNVGYEAVMLRYIGTKTYNEDFGTSVGSKIFSGQDSPYDLDDMFIDNEPENMNGDFSGNNITNDN